MKAKIGLEVHVQLNTRSKLFCGCPTKATEMPNSYVCETCLGHPGSKPRLNRKALEFATKVALALGCRLPAETFFSRKTYFYPDMPKNFQITQYETPIATDGAVELQKKTVRIRRINVEEDPGRLVHVGGDITKADYALVDYNRSGIPLLEIVTEPDMSSPEEARAFLDKLRLVLEYLGVFDVDSGIMKCDANISIAGGSRVEVKNILGFRAVEKALKFEALRQQRLLKTKAKIVQETRHFDDLSGVTKALRLKETEEDYGYIFEPDLPVYTLAKQYLDKVKAQLPELPDARISRFVKQYKLNKELANAIVSADKAVADFFERCAELYPSKRLGRWVALEIIEYMNKMKIRFSELRLNPEHLVELARLVDRNQVSDLVARRRIIPEMLATGKGPKEIAEHKRYSITKDSKKVLAVVKEILVKNKKVVQDLRSGRKEVIHYLVGEVCKRVKADPKEVLRLIRKHLSL